MKKKAMKERIQNFKDAVAIQADSIQARNERIVELEDYITEIKAKAFDLIAERR
jgi:uncharacterized coiled-coil protein SlyX